MKEEVKRKKEVYRKALNEKTQEAWERYKKASTWRISMHSGRK